MWPLAVLTGDRINVFFLIRKSMARPFGCNNEVTVLPRWPKAGFHRTSDH